MIRFFVAFLFLALSSISYSATHTYYKAGNVCSFSKEKFCADDLKFKESLYGSSVVVSQISCTANTQTVTLNWQYARKNWIDGSLYDIDKERYSTSAEVMRAECDGQLTLYADCSTFCAKDDPCLAKKDQIVKLEELCGLSQCPTGSTFNSSGICKKANGTTVPAQQVLNVPSSGQTGDFDGCEVISLDTPDAGSKGYYKNTDTGKQDLPTYCPVNYKYTGNKSNNSGTQNGLPASTTSPSANDKPTLPDSLYYPDNESCKPGDSHGQYGVGDSMVDVCSKGSNNDNGQQGCPVGEIRNNQGDCVPYKDATKCPNDAIRDNMGNCPTSPNNGGGSGGSCTISGQTQVNGTCQCPSGQTVQNGSCAVTGSGDSNNNGGGSGGSCTISGQTQVNGTCQCPSGQTVKNNKCTSSSSNGNEASNGSYTGSRKCEEAPQCEGDVVQCGLMAEQYKAKCEMLEQLGSVPDDVQQAANELGEEVTNNQDINGMKQAVTGYMNTLQSLVVPSNSACVISNIQLQILAKTIEIPLSQFCPFFELIRLMLNITIDLIVLRIVSRAVLSAG